MLVKIIFSTFKTNTNDYNHAVGNNFNGRIINGSNHSHSLTLDVLCM